MIAGGFIGVEPQPAARILELCPIQTLVAASLASIVEYSPPNSGNR